MSKENSQQVEVLSTKVEKIKSDRKFKIAIIVVIFGLLFFLGVTFFKVGNENIAYLIIGQVGGVLTTVLAYYFGSGDNDKKEENQNKEVKNEKTNS